MSWWLSLVNPEMAFHVTHTKNYRLNNVLYDSKQFTLPYLCDLTHYYSVLHCFLAVIGTLQTCFRLNAFVLVCSLPRKSSLRQLNV